MRSSKLFKAGVSLGCILGGSLLFAQAPATPGRSSADVDHDGLSDALEQKVLLQFMPTFMMSTHDCSVLPAEFKTGSQVPQVDADNGTIYEQAFPVKNLSDGSQAVELHYYHLWRKDCGRHGHALDTEHVAALIQPSNPDDLDSAQWKATYWYAAAHENTVCDVSQIARASALDAEEHGATVWVSPGKHASYLSSSLCQKGCGADRCVRMTALVPAKAINLGEPGFPMNGSAFISSTAWPLKDKMSTSNFPAATLARVDALPDTGIARFNPGRHPVQGIVATSSTTEQAIANGGAHTTAAMNLAGTSTDDALSRADESTGAALSNASNDTGSALGKSYRHTRHALGTSIRHIGAAIHATPAQNEQQPH